MVKESKIVKLYSVVVKRLIIMRQLFYDKMYWLYKYFIEVQINLVEHNPNKISKMRIHVTKAV